MSTSGIEEYVTQKINIISNIVSNFHKTFRWHYDKKIPYTSINLCLQHNNNKFISKTSLLNILIFRRPVTCNLIFEMTSVRVSDLCKDRHSRKSKWTRKQKMTISYLIFKYCQSNTFHLNTSYQCLHDWISFLDMPMVAVSWWAEVCHDKGVRLTAESLYFGDWGW